MAAIEAPAGITGAMKTKLQKAVTSHLSWPNQATSPGTPGSRSSPWNVFTNLVSDLFTRYCEEALQGHDGSRDGRVADRQEQAAIQEGARAAVQTGCGVASTREGDTVQHCTVQYLSERVSEQATRKKQQTSDGPQRCVVYSSSMRKSPFTTSSVRFVTSGVLLRKSIIPPSLIPSPT